MVANHASKQKQRKNGKLIRYLPGTYRANLEYVSWCGMRQRCTNPNNPAYPLYGGRGITICDRWMSSFELFLKDMGRKPGPSYSIDRIDNNGNYTPGNCHWTTPDRQVRNRRSVRPLTIDGVTRLLLDWSIISGIHYTAIIKRLRKGMTIKEAVFTKSMKGLNLRMIDKTSKGSALIELANKRNNVK